MAHPTRYKHSQGKKAAERAADIWEQELMNEYHKKLEAESAGKAYQIPAEKRHDDFVSFVNDVWFPLQVRDGKHKPKTIAFYESMTKLLLPCFSGSTLWLAPIRKTHCQRGL